MVGAGTYFSIKTKVLAWSPELHLFTSHTLASANTEIKEKCSNANTQQMCLWDKAVHCEKEMIKTKEELYVLENNM